VATGSLDYKHAGGWQRECAVALAWGRAYPGFVRELISALVVGVLAWASIVDVNADAPRTTRPSAPRLDQKFADRSLGFSVAYPESWIAARENPFLVVFSGREGTEAYRVTVGIENVRPPGAATPTAATAAVIADFKTRLARAVPDLRTEAETPIFRGEGDKRIEGSQFLVNYRLGDESFRKWVVIMRRAAAPVVHIWSYTAPSDRFDAFRLIAEAMLESWTIEDSR
jgi:hypothetical protein